MYYVLSTLGFPLIVLPVSSCCSIVLGQSFPLLLRSLPAPFPFYAAAQLEFQVWSTFPCGKTLARMYKTCHIPQNFCVCCIVMIFFSQQLNVFVSIVGNFVRVLQHQVPETWYWCWKLNLTAFNIAYFVKCWKNCFDIVFVLSVFTSVVIKSSIYVYYSIFTCVRICAALHLLLLVFISFVLLLYFVYKFSVKIVL
jgi:hypothetical protein